VHRKLHEAGVDAVLNVYEGQSHVEYLADPFAPETNDYIRELVIFFNKYLAK
jgi:hypothetical protein